MVLLHVADGAGQKAAGAAGGVEQRFAGLRVDALNHEGGKRAWGVIFTRIAGRLQVVQNLFVDFAKMLALRQAVEIHIADLVDHLADQLA